MSKKLVKSEKNVKKASNKTSKEIVRSESLPDKQKERSEKSKDLHRPEYQMIVKEKLNTTNMLLLLLVYTVGVVFVTLSFVRDSCF